MDEYTEARKWYLDQFKSKKPLSEIVLSKTNLENLCRASKNFDAFCDSLCGHELLTLDELDSTWISEDKFRYCYEKVIKGNNGRALLKAWERSDNRELVIKLSASSFDSSLQNAQTTDQDQVAEICQNICINIREKSTAEMTDFNRLVVKEKSIGRGNFGYAWKVTDLGDKKCLHPFAIKVIGVPIDKSEKHPDPNREVEICQLIKQFSDSKRDGHPGKSHVVHIEDSWCIPGSPDNFIVCQEWLTEYQDRQDHWMPKEEWDEEIERVIFIRMEFCNKGSLSNWLRCLGSSGDHLKKGKKYFKEIVLGLSFLHECQPSIIHRDLHPGNVLLSNKNGPTIAKIGDFGCSRGYSPASSATMTNSIGASQFRAPEIHGNRNYTEKVDIFSVGILLIFIFAPAYYSRQNDDLQRLVRKLQRSSPSIPDDAKIPPEVQNLLNECLSNNPEERPTSREIGERLDRIWARPMP